MTEQTTTPDMVCDSWDGGTWWCDQPCGHDGEHVAYVTDQAGSPTEQVGNAWA